MFCWVSSSCFLALEGRCESRRVKGEKKKEGKKKMEREAAVGGWEEGVVLTAFHS